MSTKFLTIEEEVDGHLSDDAPRYKDLLFAILKDVDHLTHNDHGLVVRRIYSRSEKQNGEELKGRDKIIKSLKRARETEQLLPVGHLGDIIGITIACYFPSHIDIVTGYIGAIATINILEQKYKDDSGYHARHLTIEHTDPKYFGLRGEIQIKTMLHDAWAAKTHPLIYKPIGDLDPKVQRMMQVLGDTLQTIEEQSELIKSMIEQGWNTDHEGKIAAKRILIKYLDVVYGSDDALAHMTTKIPQAKERFNHIRQQLLSSRDQLAIADIRDGKIMELLEHIRTYVDEYGRGLGSTCVLAVMLANLRVNSDLNHIALHYIDELIRTRDQPREKIYGMNFKALVLYSLGSCERAIEVTKEGLRLCKGNGWKDEESRLKANLAYYIAEECMQKPEERAARKEEAEGLIKEAEEAGPQPPLCSTLDTAGFVKVAFGTTEAEIEDGLTTCRAARDGATGSRREVAEVFYDLHKRQAWRRLLEVTEAQEVRRGGVFGRDAVGTAPLAPTMQLITGLVGSRPVR